MPQARESSQVRILGLGLGGTLLSGGALADWAARAVSQAIRTNPKAINLCRPIESLAKTPLLRAADARKVVNCVLNRAQHADPTLIDRSRIAPKDNMTQNLYGANSAAKT